VLVLGDNKLVSFQNGYSTNTKQLENSLENHKLYVEMFDICFISYSANFNTIFEFLLCALQLWTHRRWLRPVKFATEAFEGTVASKVGIPGLSYIPIGRSRKE
jgi:hypothetical protein